MPSPADNPNAPELPELAALADGSLTDPGRRAELERQIEASPELSALYERERRVVMALREARQERAPEALRRRIEADRPPAAKRLQWRIGYGVGLAGALAAVVLALVLVLPGGSGGPSVAQAAALALKGPVYPGPAPDPSAPAVRLGQSVGTVYFPNWAGWKAVGQRIDTIGGRRAVTVYYRRGARVLAYTIVNMPALRQPAAAVTWSGGVAFRTLHVSGRLVVTWRRDGQTCVLSGAAVSRALLQSLASWDSPLLHASDEQAVSASRVKGSRWAA